MKTKGAINAKTNLKYKQFIMKLHFVLKDGAENFKMGDFIAENKISGRLVTTMKNKGIIKKEKRDSNYFWIWNTIPPTSLMIKRVIDETRKLQQIQTENKVNKVKTNFEEIFQQAKQEIKNENQISEKVDKEILEEEKLINSSMSFKIDMLENEVEYLEERIHELKRDKNALLISYFSSLLLLALYFILK